MKLKKGFIFLLGGIIIFSGLTFVFVINNTLDLGTIYKREVPTVADEFELEDNSVVITAVEDMFELKSENKPIVITQNMDVSSGSISSSTGFDSSWTLNFENGKHINFYIENTGDIDINATINDGSEKLFKAGETGYIYANVDKGFLGDKEYRFKAVSAKYHHGGTVNINYKITQGDSE